MRARSSALATTALLAAIALAPSASAAPIEPPLPTVPVIVSIAQEKDKPVVDPSWVEAQLAQAARLFGGAGVPLRSIATRPLPARFAHLETRADRDALATELQRGVINVMIVSTLRDVDDRALFRMGVHWRPAKDPKKHYVIVAASAAPTTMAHEIGHFFGSGHTTIVDNLMSYDRAGDAIFLTDAQAKQSRAFCRLYLRIKELDPGLIAPPPPPPPAPPSGPAPGAP